MGHNDTSTTVRDIQFMTAFRSSAITRRLAIAALAAALGTGFAAPQALAQEKVTYLFPAPPILPAFAPLQLAKGKGYFKDAGLDVDFQVARGGVEVAKMVGAGNAPIGGMRMSLTSDDTILPNAPPIITPTAMSITFPLSANSLNSLKKAIYVRLLLKVTHRTKIRISEGKSKLVCILPSESI